MPLNRFRRWLIAQKRSWASRWALKRLKSALGSHRFTEGTYFSVLMPGCLHIARFAIQSFPGEKPLALIGNGLSPAERAWCQRNFPGQTLIASRRVLAHGSIIEVLLNTLRIDFGLIDYDCFVLEPSLLADMTSLPERTSVNTAYSYRSRDGQTELPDTYLLYFRKELLARIMREYGVGPGTYRWEEIPPRARARLRERGYGENHLPEAHKDFFDTLRVACLLSECEGWPLGYVERYWGLQGYVPGLRAFHIGNVSSPSENDSPYVQRGTLFWALSLLIAEDKELLGFAEGYFGPERTRNILSSVNRLRDVVSDDFLAFCERLFTGERLRKVFLQQVER